MPSRSTVYGLLLSVASVCVTAAGLEVALRIYHGRLFHFESLTHGRVGFGRAATSIADYDDRLGWVPRPGRFVRPEWSWQVDEAGLRSNGRPVPAAGGRIAAVGDSFTFGDEVDDHDTWPSQLEALLEVPVLNAGVFAYGIDQACLRAERLLDTHAPDVIVLAFISSDVERTQLSYYHRTWKPYFEYVNGALELRNVPVPRGNAVSERLPALSRALGYSFLARTVLLRTPLGEWYRGPHRLQVHTDGLRVAAELIARLDRLARSRGARFLAVTLATDGRIGGNGRLPALVQRLRDGGVTVLDTASEMLQMERDTFVRMFSGKGHYAPAMNGWVADRLAAFLRARPAPPRAMAGARD
jgi:hypothetical protein